MLLSKKLEFILLVLVLLFSFILIYGVHCSYTGLVQNPHSIPPRITVTDYNYPYPIHADEWAHLAQAVYIMDSKTFGFTNPYSPNLAYHKDLELGFHLFLALFFGLSGIDPVLGYQYLPALFFVINSVFLFLFVRKFIGNYYIAIFSILFFLAVPSNRNLLGNWFAIPLTFSVFLIYLFFISFDKFLQCKEKKYLVFSIAAYLLSALIYPFAAVLISLILLFYLIFEVKIHKFYFVKKNARIFSIACLVLLIILLYVFYNYLLNNFIFDRAWTSFQYDYSPVFFYGLLPTLLAVVGFSIILVKRMNKIFIIWPLLCLANLLLYKLIDKGLFIPYERTFYYYFLGLVPLAAIGLYSILELIYNYLNNYFSSYKYKKQTALFLTLILVLFNFYFIFNDYYNTKDQSLALLYLLEQQDYEAIKFIGENFGKGNIVLADDFISIGVYPISKNHVVAMAASNLGYGDPRQLLIFFFRSDCREKLEIINQHKVDFVLSRFSIDCRFLEKIYDDKDYIYRVKK